ncbi:MAG: hypothetical protein GWN71_08945, partial [Gammaproteobacteria bacterium]|nr:hypothetical protein [Gemmatimonadota bacterium]NIU73690.1 hypothetical protein [Gammaproteobacteria bacterium]
MLDEAAAAERLARYAPELEPAPFGEHALWVWNYLRDQALFWPWFRRDAAAVRP